MWLVKQIGGLTLSDAVKRAWERVGLLSLEVIELSLTGVKKTKGQVTKAWIREIKSHRSYFQQVILRFYLFTLLSNNNLFLAEICIAPEFAQVSNATLQEETRKAVKHAAKTFINKHQRALLGSASDSN